MRSSIFKKTCCGIVTGALFMSMLGMTACSAPSSEKSSSGAESTKEEILQATEPIGIHHAEIYIEGYDDPILVELDGDSAPITVQNFMDLANSNFYDGLTFHRIIENFMIQGGDPEGNGTGGSGTNILGEFLSNGDDNELQNLRGAIAMARSNDPDSASSQFFIVQEDSPHLDGDYAVFGNVTEGMDVVDDIASKAKPKDDHGTISKNEQPVIEKIVILD